MANTALIVTGLNFDTIRQNLRNYIASKPDFADYDFADSAIGTLLDLLAYNTYYGAFYTNMAASEAFIDSAQFYDSVVSRAKMLGYTPTSAQGATANVRIRFTTATANASRPTLTISKNTKFSATVNGVSYTFVTPRSYTINANASNKFQEDIELVEGYPITHRFLFTSSNTSFVLPNEKTDTRSISIQVTSGANTYTYELADNINSINSSSRIFFVEADRDRLYKIGFGDNVLGLRPPYNSTVAVTYRICNGLAGNGANNFTAISTVAGESAFTLSVNERARGGTEQETIESIKFNATKDFTVQNRSVVASDYQRIILRDNRDIQAVNVWGGEENDPPIYGKTYASVKPYQGTLISSARKQQIKNTIRKYNVQSIDLEIVDPTILYIVPTISIQYDSRLTTKTGSELAATIANRIITYETNNFSRFDSKFWYSKFLTFLDAADRGIVSSSAIIDLQKRFIPSTSVKNTYTFKYNNSLQSLGKSDSAVENNNGYGWLTSSGFTRDGFTAYLDDTGFGTIRTYYNNIAISKTGRVYLNSNSGEIDYVTGTVILRNFLPSAFIGSEIKLNVRPIDPNIQAVRNQLLFFSDVSITVKEINTGAVSTLTSIAVAGQSTTLNESGLTTITSY